MPWEEYELNGKKGIGLACPQATGVPGTSGDLELSPAEEEHLMKNIYADFRHGSGHIRTKAWFIRTYLECKRSGFWDALWLYFALVLQQEEFTPNQRTIGIKLGILFVSIEHN